MTATTNNRQNTSTKDVKIVSRVQATPVTSVLSIDKLAEDLAKKQAAIEAEKAQLEELKAKQAKSQRLAKEQLLEEHTRNAYFYEVWAREEADKPRPDREKIENYFASIAIEKQQIERLQSELGITTEVTKEETVPVAATFLAKHQAKFWVFSLLLTLLSVIGLYNIMMNYKAEIDAHNAKTIDPSLKIGNPYDESSIQGIVYDNLIQATDIPKLFLWLLILMPPIFFYSIPIIKTKVSPWKDWQQLEASQRLWLFFAWSATVFLVSALYHVSGSMR